MTPAAHVVLTHQQGAATRRQLLAAGLTGRELATAVEDGVLSRAARGLYRDRPVPPRGEHLLSGGCPDPGFVAELRQVLLELGPRARAARRTAAVVWGMDLAVEPEVIEIDVPRGSGFRRDGVVAREARSERSMEWVPVPGRAALAVSTPLDTVIGCMGDLPLAQAVAVVDSALRRRLLTLDDLRSAIRGCHAPRGAAQLRQVLRWCDPRCGSVLESLLRVLLCEAGLLPPRTQHVITDEATGLTQRVDFAWPEQRLVVEVDGRRWHDPADRRDADRRRDNTCAQLGWLVLRFTWADVVHRPDDVVAAVRAALASR